MPRPKWKQPKKVMNAHFTVICDYLVHFSYFHIKIHGSIHITTKYPRCKSFGMSMKIENHLKCQGMREEAVWIGRVFWLQLCNGKLFFLALPFGWIESNWPHTKLWIWNYNEQNETEMKIYIESDSCNKRIHPSLKWGPLKILTCNTPFYFVYVARNHFWSCSKIRAQQARSYTLFFLSLSHFSHSLTYALIHLSLSPLTN